MLELGMVSSFHPHSMCKRVERVTAKTGRTSCTNWTISFEVSGFPTRTHLLHWHFIFLNLLQLQTFFAFSMHHSKPRHQLSTLSDIDIFHSFTDLFWELNDHEIEKHLKWTLKMLKVGMVSSFHPHSMCKRVERVTAKTGCSSCTNRTLSFEVWGFRTKKLICYTDTSFFKLITTPDFFCVQYAPFKAKSSTFNPFWDHLLFFSHLPICLES